MSIPARLPSSHVNTRFSDQSHLLFYGGSSSSHCRPIKSRFHTDLFSSSPLPLAYRRGADIPPLLSSSHPSPSTMPAGNASAGLDLLNELATLKAQIKRKKKQLKAMAKDRKAALKRKKAKAKDVSSTSSSSSSSSSEASDAGRMPLKMRLLKKHLSQTRDGKGVAVRGDSHGLDHTDIQDRNDDIKQCVPSMCAPIARSNQRRSHRALGAVHAHVMSGSIEVCVGGKCKKAGSQQLLSSVKAQIPADAHVDATPCKCMGRCGAAINVKVSKEDTNPQHHSHVRIDDAGLILSHHFGLGPPLFGLPRVSSLSLTNC